MVIDHIGYAVKQIVPARQELERLGYVFGQKYDDFDRNVEIQFGEKDGYRMELIAPMKEGKSPVDVYLKKTGAIMYHICYRSKNIYDDIKELEAQGYVQITERQPAVALGGRNVVFMMNSELGMLEIVEN